MTVRHFVTETRAEVAGLRLLVRVSMVFALGFGALGCSCGLVLGLIAYPPTAWFAVLEVGLPAAALGFLVGLATGLAMEHARGVRP
jgi:hypothetical protein